MERHMCLWIGKLNIIKISFFPKLSYKLNVITIFVFVDIAKLIIKFMWNRSINHLNILEKEELSRMSDYMWIYNYLKILKVKLKKNLRKS